MSEHAEAEQKPDSEDKQTGLAGCLGGVAAGCVPAVRAATEISAVLAVN